MQLALIGVGLIGGSAAWTMKQAGIFESVSACDLCGENVEKAARLGIVDRVAETIEDALVGADAVMVAVPVLAMPSVFEAVGKYALPKAYITDVGSCRESVIEAARKGLGEKFVNYAPVHPIAGGEMPGIDYADKHLFEGAKAISTPEFGMGEESVLFWEKAWKAAGSNVMRMSAHEHDAIFAEVSHLPHVLSFVMVDSLMYGENFDRRLSFAGAGFRDFTRIAASSSRMWSDICVANRDAILTALSHFESDLARVRKYIEAGDIRALQDAFEKASDVRRRLFVRKPLN